MKAESLRRRYRFVLGGFILLLVLSGVTAFPLLHELELLARWVGVGPEKVQPDANGLQWWIGTVRDGLRDVHARYPWLAYGTDWLAFGHLVIAMFFIGPWKHPEANAWVLRVGIAACLAVIPLALICGPIRGIPFYWQLIDCSFGGLGMLPLLYCLRLTRRMEDAENAARSRIA
jgi:hypothetical protein